MLRAPASSTTVWPGDYIELSIPSVLDDLVVAVEPRNDYSPLCHQNWPEPAIVEAVGDKIRLVNKSGEPLKLRRNKHFCQVRHTVDATTYSDNTRKHNIVNNVISRPVDNTTFSDNIELDRDNLLTDDTRKQFRDLHRRFDSVFDPTIVCYNGHVGPFSATVNMGPVIPPPSFLVRKSNGRSRLVTAFTEVGRYSKPQPSLMPVLRELPKRDTEYVWLHQHAEAFSTIKSLICKTTILAYFDTNKDSVLQVDRSQKGLGAVLMQDSRPIAFCQ